MLTVWVITVNSQLGPSPVVVLRTKNKSHFTERERLQCDWRLWLDTTDLLKASQGIEWSLTSIYSTVTFNTVL